MHRWDCEPTVFAERIAACKACVLGVPALISKSCVHRGCTKCVTDMDWDVLMDLMKPDADSQVYYGISRLDEAKDTTDAGKEVIRNIQRELMDTCVSSTLWDKDVDTSAIAVIDAFVKANLLLQQQALLQGAGACLKWRDMRDHGQFQVVEQARTLLKSSDKIARQFSNLPLGAKILAEIDAHAALVKQHQVLSQKLTAIKSFAASPIVKNQMASSKTSLHPLQRIQSELLGITTVGGAEFVAAFASDIKGVEANITRGVELMIKDKRKGP